MHWICVNATEACGGGGHRWSPTPGRRQHLLNAPPSGFGLHTKPPLHPRPTPTTYIPPLSPHTGHYCLLRGYPQLMQANSIQLTRCLCFVFFSKGGKVLLKYICVLVSKELNCRSSGVSSKAPPIHLHSPATMFNHLETAENKNL